MDLTATLTAPPHRGVLRCGDKEFPCVFGRGGIRADKREGDGTTPAGCFELRQVLYRADRLAPPETIIPARALDPADGWCDDPGDKSYNRPVRLPHAARAEKLWRDDGQYDVIAVLGYNDGPAVPGRGSAIFLHVAKADNSATQGCVALALADLLAVLKEVAAGSRLCVAAD